MATSAREARVERVRQGICAEQWTRGTIEQLADRLVRTGLASAADVELFLTTTALPSTHYVPPLMVSAWGRRPER